MAAPFARNVLLVTRARLAPTVAVRAASSLSTSAFSGSFAQSPAILMMALDRAPAQTVVGAVLSYYCSASCRNADCVDELGV